MKRILSEANARSYLKHAKCAIENDYMWNWSTGQQLISNIDFLETDVFKAEVNLKSVGVNIRLSFGVIHRLTQIWNNFYKYKLGLDKEAAYNKKQFDQFVQRSLVWLLLHEAKHYELGHFKILGIDQISVTSGSNEFGLVSRANKQLSPLPDIDRIKLERCLELQADHEAIDMFLESYSVHEWEVLRRRIACIVAVMVLIDVEDTKNNIAHSSHPKAATRIFQLMGHVSEMPLIPVQAKAMADNQPIDHDQIPSEEEQQAFVNQVAIPAFYDAIALAKAAGAEHVIKELGDLPAFFQDVLLAKTNSDGDPSQFKTEGAKEWAELLVINERLKDL